MPRKRKIFDAQDADVEYRDISVKVKLGRLLPSPDVRYKNLRFLSDRGCHESRARHRGARTAPGEPHPHSRTRLREVSRLGESVLVAKLHQGVDPGAREEEWAASEDRPSSSRGIPNVEGSHRIDPGPHALDREHHQSGCGNYHGEHEDARRT